MTTRSGLSPATEVTAFTESMGTIERFASTLAEQLAAWCGTIAYELTCRVGRRVVYSVSEA